ncbi:MAG: hypothetical protein K2P92_03150 [Bdellovibrionaceae bacterium]|nr:hypothetical protein [Pseudobdellovibrionaceae bacterium]
MKTLAGLIAFAAVVLFAFQNCSKTTAFQSEMAGRSLDSVFSVEKQNLSEINVGAVQLFIPDSKVVTQSGSTYSLKYNKILEINLDSGEMIVSNDVDSTVGQYCVPAAMMAEMTEMMRSAQLCRERKNLPADAVCAQVYTMPYAKLMTSGSDIDLGSAATSCADKTDLCGEAKAQFQDMITRMNANYSGYTCPQ